MLRTEQMGKPQANRTGWQFQPAASGMSALFLLLIVASLAAVLAACGDDPAPTPVPTAITAPEPTPEPAATTAPEPAPEAATLDDDAITRAFIATAIEYYEENGLDATVKYYKTEAGIEDGRPLTLLDAEESVVLVFRALPTLEGQYVGPGSRFSGLGRMITDSTEDGVWSTDRGINPVTKQEEPRRVFVIRHDGLVFAASHSALTEDVAGSTKEYVNKAIAKYNDDGLDAVIAHYNSQDSLDGQFYLFLIGADDN